MKRNLKTNLYKQAHRFADTTKKLVVAGHFKLARRCFQEAEMIFNNGSSEVKNAISNCYVFSVSTFMELHQFNIKELLPPSLLREYYKQVNASGK